MPREKTDNDDDSGSRSDEECAENEDDASELKPVRPKIGEAEDNLKQREDWFQKRSGKK